MMKINWNDYQGKFQCPFCQILSIHRRGQSSTTKKKVFRCYLCNKQILASCNLNFKCILDPNDNSTVWYNYKGYKIPSFVCPHCYEENVSAYKIETLQEDKKVRFSCKSCGKGIRSSIDLSTSNIKHYAKKIPPIKPFNFKDDEWDLRSLSPKQESKSVRKPLVNFKNINPDWYKLAVKKYVQHFCKSGKSISTISVRRIYDLKNFGKYLEIIAFLTQVRLIESYL